jgi:hypothetical protein
MSAQVELFHDLDSVERDAAGALARDKRSWMFDRLEWFRLVHDFTPPKGRLLALRARNGKGNAWLFLGVDRGRARAYSNWYCLRFGPVVDGGDPAAAVDELARGLRRGGVAQLSVSPIAKDDPLAPALKRQGWLTRSAQSSVSWRIRVSGKSFEQYWAERPSKLRNTAKRRAKTAGLELRVLDRFDPAAWADYESVYENSWKPAEGSPDLMRKLAEAEGKAGTLRLGLAYQGGAPVAAQLWTVEQGVATIHKLAYREDAKHYSPGTVLSVEMFRRAIDEDKVDMIDFGIGNDPYKADWMDEAEPLYALTAYDLRSPKGLAAAAAAAVSMLVGKLRSR